jgi:hypothetical protein
MIKNNKITMKNLKLLLFAAAAMMLQTNLFAQNPSVTIVNNTGYTVFFVHMSPPAAPEWGPDMLASNQVLHNGQSATLRLPVPLNVVNRYDIMLIDSDGDAYIKRNVLISTNSRIVFTFDDFVGQNTEIRPASSGTGPMITIVNNTGYTVYFVYLSPTSDTEWGPDRLARDQILYNGQSVALRLPVPISITNRYDIRLVDLDGDSYTKYNVLVSANSRIVFTFDDFD